MPTCSNFSHLENTQLRERCPTFSLDRHIITSLNSKDQCMMLPLLSSILKNENENEKGEFWAEQ